MNLAADHGSVTVIDSARAVSVSQVDDGPVVPATSYTRSEGRWDRGSGTMAGVALIMIVAVLLSSAATAGRLLVRRAQVRGAADLSALSAAVVLRDGGDDPCGVARSVADGNAARLISCEIGGENGEDVTVRVGTATQVPFMPEIAVDARAGPVPCD